MAAPSVAPRVTATPICTVSSAQSWVGTGTSTVRTMVPVAGCGGSGRRTAAGAADPSSATPTAAAASQPTMPEIRVSLRGIGCDLRVRVEVRVEHAYLGDGVHG
jgi:hypothetical protein